jgi:hypothetical protein
MKKLLLASIAALLLATGAAHAADDRASDIACADFPTCCSRAKAELEENPTPKRQAAYDRCIKPATTVAQCKRQFAYGGEINWTPEHDAAYQECLKHVRATKRQMRKQR